jgi:hypothetical protein
MSHRKTSKRSKAKTMLRLADLEQSKHAVLHSLGAASSQESCNVRLAYEASDTGLLSPDLAAGIRRVKRRKASGRTDW